jgi:mono/diheme cytochrome c family protein
LTGLRGIAALVVLAGALFGVSIIGMAAGQDAEEAPAVFTEAYLNDSANIEAGKAIWQEQCRLCHGYAAYPGKAPKLKPRRYKPGFVFKRVTNGFRKMPSWKEVYSREERMAVVTYVLSKEFSP